MKSCYICKKENCAKERKLFFNGVAPLCDQDYISFLEILVKSSDEELSSSAMEDALNQLKNTLAPSPKTTVTIPAKEKISFKPRSCETEEEEYYYYRMGM